MPADIEAMIVLVASIDFIDEPLYALVRLHHHIDMKNIVSAEVPVRFVFFILAPKNESDDVDEQHRQHEEHKQVGRAFSTIMADDHFKVM